MPTVIDLSSESPRILTIIGEAASDNAGFSVADAGDVNGDGFADIIIGAPFNNAGDVDAGRAYVIFGGPDRSGTIDLDNLDPTDGLVIQGDTAYDQAGFAVSAAGDINGDGFADILVGSIDGYGGFYYGSTLRCYVIFGGRDAHSIDLSSLSSSDGFVINGKYSYAYGNFSVSGAGDINGDGFDDIIVGDSKVGATYVVFGRATGFGSTIDLSTLSPDDGFTIVGPRSDAAGRSVSAAGDVNGDGVDDLIVGAYGEAYVIFGRSNGLGTVNLDNLGSNGFIILGDSADPGFSVSSAGDVNNDGFDDLIVGAPLSDNGGDAAGEAYVVFGRAGNPGTIDLSSLGGGGFIIQGDVAQDQLGWSVSGAGDVNGDGFADVIVGAPFGDDGGNSAGEAYVIFGRASGVGTVDVTNLSSGDGFIIRGNAAFDLSGWSVSAAGDVDRDGFDDLIVGARQAGLGGNAAGQAYVIFGNGIAANSRGIAGDFNGDGRDDILWRHESGRVTDWLGQTSGGFIGNFANSDAYGGLDWQIVGIGDFNNDGRDDILWRNVYGDVTDWLAQANGSFTSNFGNAYYNVAPSWDVAGTGDFNGDGRDDILWRHESGRVTNWLGQGNGGFTPNFANADADAGTDWHIVGIGDFNGDNRDDILWRNNNGDVTNWLGQPNSGFASNFGNAFYQVESGWQVAGIGDFNADGRADILWRHDSGRITNWLGEGTGGFTSNLANSDANVGDDWHIVSIGDFNGDNRDDILWRNNDGDVTDWLGQSDGSFASNFGDAFYSVDPRWDVQPVGDYLI